MYIVVYFSIHVYLHICIYMCISLYLGFYRQFTIQCRFQSGFIRNGIDTDGWLVVDPCKTPGAKKRLCQNRSLNFSVLTFLPDFHLGFRR